MFTVILPGHERCLIKNRRLVTGSSGILSNLVTQETGCGSPTLPWVIQVNPGQKVNVTLVDFSMITEPGTSACKVFAVIKERTIGRVRNITSCTTTRERSIYMSVTNVIEIGLVTVMDPMDRLDSPMFMIKYEGICFCFCTQKLVDPH